MRIWLYSHLVNSPGNQLISDEAASRGHELRLVRPHSLNIVPGQIIEDLPDVVYARVGGAAPDSAIDELQILEGQGAFCLNSAVPIRRARHKGITYSVLAGAGVAIPKTVLLSHRQELSSALSALSGPPWILKLPLSTKGQGVCLVESLRSLRSVLDVVGEREGPVVLQEFVAHSKGADVRVLVLGGKAVLAARRQAQSGDEFRSNVYLGGKAHQVELTEAIKDISEQATRALGLEIAGVDLLESENGYLVVEVNSSPGLTASPLLPGLVVDFLEMRAG
ncbi:MAG TPA: RimK family alpha-L-glutamate ligase [Phycisphaerales bacterium]|nr:RimK family alpha-L-glutamate ligase [Phycisphaerales bacterium]